MADEAAQGLSPDVPITGPTDVAATPASAEATPGAPTFTVGGKTYTQDEVQTNLANYQQLQGNYTRATQELSRAHDAVEFANVLEKYPDLRDQFVSAVDQRVKGPVPTPSPTGEPGREISPEVAALQQEVEGMKRERALEWAGGQWTDMRSKFTGIMGRAPTQQDELQVQQYLDSTGSANLWSATLAVFHDQFMGRASVLKEQQALAATQAAAGIVTEGQGAPAPEGPTDWATADLDTQIAKARAMTGASPDPSYNRYVDFGTEK